MSVKSVLIHLRFPFSLFLAPIAMLGLLAAWPLDAFRTVMVMVVIHALLYTASNAYNSWYDRDEGPIGGIERPPQVTKGLLFASLTLDVGSVLVGLTVGPFFALGMLIYGTFSKIYSHPKTRWKARPLVSLIGLALVQGLFVFLLVAWHSGTEPLLPVFRLGPSSVEVSQALTEASGEGWQLTLSGFAELHEIFSPQLLLGGLIAALFLCGVYPLTQVYQHEEDARHGDLTYSRFVGIRGTFLSSAIFLSLTAIAFVVWFVLKAPADELFSSLLRSLLPLLLCLTPGLLYFFGWWNRVRKDTSAANFASTMKMNTLASAGMIAYFVIEYVILQLA